MKKIDWKYTSFAAFSLLALFLLHKNYDDVLYITKCILSFPFLNLYAGSVATIFTLLDKIKSRKIELKKMMTIKEFSGTIGDVISFIDNPIIIVGSLTLMKGLFFQVTENKEFMPLDGVELTFIIIVTLYLLYSSLLELWNTIAGTCLKNPISTDTPHPSLSSDVQELPIPEPHSSNE
jgi:hypothetical protein